MSYTASQSLKESSRGKQEYSLQLHNPEQRTRQNVAKAESKTAETETGTCDAIGNEAKTKEVRPLLYA
jgi:oligoendopeptidase F